MYFVYFELLNRLTTQGVVETNARTSTTIKMIPGGYSFKLSLEHGKLPVAGNRKYWPHIAAAEVAWQFMGTKDPEFILKHAPKIWQDFVETDGKIETAYGYRWRGHFGRDQLAMAIEELRSNPTNRQLYISAWDPGLDGLGGDQPKNVPCPVGFSVTRTKNDLHMSVFIRSSDVFVGLPYDIMGYALMLDALAASVDCTPSTLHFTLAHPHCYKPHFLMMDECVQGTHRSWTEDVQPSLPGWSMAMILENPDGYVDTVKTLANRVHTSNYNPKPILVV